MILRLITIITHNNDYYCYCYYFDVSIDSDYYRVKITTLVGMDVHR